jgi:hypothetical protein
MTSGLARPQPPGPNLAGHRAVSRGRLQDCPETVELPGSRGIAVHVLRSEQAVRRYNELYESERVAGLVHATC